MPQLCFRLPSVGDGNSVIIVSAFKFFGCLFKALLQIHDVTLRSTHKHYLFCSFTYSIDIQCFPLVTGDILSQILIQINSCYLYSAVSSYVLSLLN